MEVRYVEEDDEEGEEGSGEADEDDEAELGEVGQGRETKSSAPGREQTRQAGHGGQLMSMYEHISINHIQDSIPRSSKLQLFSPILKPVVESWAS